MALFAIFFLAFYFASVCGLGYIVFSPFKVVAAAAPSKDMRFGLVDLLAIFPPFAMGYSALNRFFPDIDWSTNRLIFFCVVAFVITGVSWFYGMRLLWRMRIDSSIKRIVLLGIVMPAGFVVPAVALPVLIDVQSAGQFGYRFAVLVCIIFAMRILASWVRAGGDLIGKQVPDAV